MIVSITELNLKNFWSFLIFIPHAVKSKIQASKAKGLVFIDLQSEGLLVQRTLSAWETEQDVRNYIKSGNHLKAMKALGRHSKTSYTARYTSETMPTWDEALAYLRKNGKSHYEQ